MHLVRETYQRLFNKTPNIQIIHAGLECGLFKKPYPEMDMVSIGPTITGPHSPDEQVHIERRRSVLDAADRAAESHSG